MDRQKLIRSLKDKLDRIAHDTLNSPPDTLQGLYKAVGRYQELSELITKLQTAAENEEEPS